MPYFSSDFVVLLDGVTWTTDTPMDSSDLVIITHDLDLNFINVTFQTGWRLDVGLAERMLFFVLTVPTAAQGNVRGLLGTFTDDVNDDLTLPDGSRLELPQSTEEIHYNFGQRCENRNIQSQKK